MDKTTHSHRGTCQACGRVQAADNGNQKLAKHGYRVAGFGYFVGTCGGSGRLPLELDATCTDATIFGLGEYAERQTALAAQYESGALLPAQVEVAHRYNRRTGRTETVHAPLEQAQQVDAECPPPSYGKTLVAREVERRIQNCRSEASQARSRAKSLARLKVERHGKPLYAAEPEKPAGRFVVRDRENGSHLVTKRNNPRREFDFTTNLAHAGRFETAEKAEGMRSLVDYWKNRRGAAPRFEVVELSS